MADQEKVNKKKVKKEEKTEEEAPQAIIRIASNVFSMFSTQQVAEFKEGFSMMDADKDGILGKEDLRATWDQVGKLVTDKELEDMLAEAPGPVNFTQLLALFAARMSEGADDEETVRNTFFAFDENGKIDSSKLKHDLLSWGNTFTPKEVANVFDVMNIDRNGLIDTEDLIQMLISGGNED